MPRNTREYQKRRIEQANGALDRYIYHMHEMNRVFEEAETEFADNLAKPGNEGLAEFTPDYTIQKTMLMTLSAIAVQLQENTTRFGSEHI